MQRTCARCGTVCNVKTSETAGLSFPGQNTTQHGTRMKQSTNKSHKHDGDTSSRMSLRQCLKHFQIRVRIVYGSLEEGVEVGQVLYLFLLKVSGQIVKQTWQKDRGQTMVEHGCVCSLILCISCLLEILRTKNHCVCTFLRCQWILLFLSWSPPRQVGQDS